MQRVTSNNVASVCTGPYLKCRYSKVPCKRTQHCWVHVASVCPPPPPPFCMLLLFVGQSLKPVKLLATLKRTQQFPALLAQQYTHQVRFRAQVKTGLFFLDWQNNNFASASPFLYISLPSLHHDVKLPNFTFSGGRKHHTAIF